MLHVGFVVQNYNVSENGRLLICIQLIDVNETTQASASVTLVTTDGTALGEYRLYMRMVTRSEKRDHFTHKMKMSY